MNVARILIADDTNADATAIRAAFVALTSAFAQKGLEVVATIDADHQETSFVRVATAPSAEAELEASIQEGRPFDFAVVDLLFDANDVGARTGLATLRVLRAISPDTKVIFNANMSEDFGRRMALVAALAAYDVQGLRAKQGVGKHSLEQVILAILAGNTPGDLRTTIPSHTPDGDRVEPADAARVWLRFLFSGQTARGERADFAMPSWRQRWECMSPEVCANLSALNFVADRVNPLLIGDGFPPIELAKQRRGLALSPVQQNHFYITHLDRFHRFEDEFGWNGSDAPKGPATRKYSDTGNQAWPQPQIAFASVAEGYGQVLRPGTYSREFMLALDKIFDWPE